jgi:hypothetical protein
MLSMQLICQSQKDLSEKSVAGNAILYPSKSLTWQIPGFQESFTRGASTHFANICDLLL